LGGSLRLANGGVGALQFGSGACPIRVTGGSKGGPTAPEAPNADRCQFNDAVHTLKELTIMSGGKDTAAPVPHKRMNRGASGSIEIVRRLVEENEVRRLDMKASDAYARALATRQGPHTAVER
jgi:hypothetical protein